jgi:hypothetical protein
MANKYDLKTAIMSIAAGGEVMTTIGAKVGSGVIASGKTRFLTYIRVNRTANVNAASAVTGHSAADGGGCMVCGLSGMNGAASFATFSMATAMTDGMLAIGLQHVTGMSDAGAQVTPPEAALVQSMPDRPDIDHPILAVGGGSTLMGIYVPSGPACRIFAQYYDE